MGVLTSKLGWIIMAMMAGMRSVKVRLPLGGVSVLEILPVGLR